MDPVIVASALGAWGTVMAAVLHRTNGSSPLSRKLDCIGDSLLRCEVRLGRIEQRVDRIEDDT